ncbi:MAG TPA: gamma-glutamylcyclotransferase [Acidimicrobiales bacterium]|nr:gamma-glutamylcyclotransferase [Acidimicrobiales bacterium]
MTSDATRVFVYGTLMPEEARWPVLAPYVTRWERATARGQLWDSGRGYPAVRFEDGAGVVPGFVVTLDAARAADVIAALDAMEGEGVLYRRVEVRTSAGEATSYEWLGSTDGLVPLPGGWPPTA